MLARVHWIRVMAQLLCEREGSDPKLKVFPVQNSWGLSMILRRPARLPFTACQLNACKNREIPPVRAAFARELSARIFEVFQAPPSLVEEARKTKVI